MASLNHVSIEFVTQGEKNMISTLAKVDQGQQKLERSAKSLESAIKRNIATEEQAIVAYLALVKGGIEYQNVLKGLEQNSKMLGAAHQSNINGLLGVDRAAKSARDSASALSDAFKEQARVSSQNQKTARAFGQLVTEVNTYATANKSAEASAEIFAKQIERVEQSNLRAAQSFGDSVREANNYTTANKSAEASAEVFARQLDRVEQANLEVARSFGESVRAVQQANLANKSAETSAQIFSQEIERLTAKFNPLYAASKRYEMQLEELNRAHMIGALNSKQHEAALEQLNMEFALGGTGVSGLAKANQHASRKINEVGMATQQVGYQVGDFLVQIQSGTNAFVAFGQQATQLVGILPLFASKLSVSVGTLIGISSGLGIAIPLITAIGAAFMRTRDTAEEAADGISELEKQLESAANKSKNLSEQIEIMNRGLGSTEELALTRGIVQAQEAVLEVENKLAEAQQKKGQGSRSILNNAQRELELAKGLVETRKIELQSFLRKEEAISLLEREKELISERDEIVKRIVATTESELQIQQDRITLAQAELTYGRESTEYKNTQLAIEERIFREQLAQNGILGNNADKILEAYRRANNLEIAVENASGSASNAASNASSLANEMSRAANESLRFVANLGSGAGLAAAQARVAGLRAEITARQGGAGDVAAAEARARAQAMGDPRTQLALQGPAGLRAETLSRIETEVETARLNAIAGGLSGQISEFGRTGTAGGVGGVRGGGGGAGVDPAEEFRKAKEAVVQLRASYDEQYATSLRVQEAQEEINKAVELGVYTKEQGKEALDDYIASLERAESPMQKLANTTRDALGDTFMSIVDGTKSAKDAFGDMARIILKQAFELLVIKPILDGIFGGITGGGGGGILRLFGGFADGGAFRSGNVIPFANGGVVGSPTMFPMAGNQTGLMGEAGPEAIMPLKRGKGGKLGVVAEGASQPVVIHQNFNFSANGDDSVKRIIAQEAPKIANMTQKQILDQRSRGGTFKQVFG